MKIALGTDHAGFELKEAVKAHLENHGHEVADYGAYEYDKDDDYPDFVLPACWAVTDGEAERAIVFGGSGQGEAIAANKVTGVRAAVWYGGDGAIIELSREHNNANVLSIGARFVSVDEALETVDRWLETDFSNDERHVRRITKFENANTHDAL